VHFLIWNPDLRADVTNHLLSTGHAAEVKTRLLDHPSDDAPEDEKQHWLLQGAFAVFKVCFPKFWGSQNQPTYVLR